MHEAGLGGACPFGIELAQTMLTVGDPAWTWFDPGQHGTAQQRAAALGIGFANGALACLPTPGGLSGFVFYDASGNGLWDANEAGWQGVTVEVTDHWGELHSTVTDANGAWFVTGLPIGRAQVDIARLPPGAVQTYGANPDTVLVATNSTYVSGYDGYYVPSSGHALDFTSDFVVVPDHADLDLTETWTIEAWIKPRVVSGDLVSKWGGCSAASYQMSLRQGRLRAGIASCASGTQVVESASVVVAGSWQHMAITLGEGTLRLYVNGTLRASKTNSLAPLNTATDVLIGSAFAGLMDEVRIWQVARTESDLVSFMYRRAVGTELGLVAYWRFDEGAGDAASDATGRGNDGRLGIASGPDTSDPAWTSDAAPIGP